MKRPIKLLLIVIVLLNFSCPPKKPFWGQIEQIEIYNISLGEIEFVDHYVFDSNKGTIQTIWTKPANYGNFYAYRENLVKLTHSDNEKVKKIGLSLVDGQKQNYEGIERLPIITLCTVKTNKGEKYYSEVGQHCEGRKKTPIDELLSLFYKIEGNDTSFRRIHVTDTMTQEEKEEAYLTLLSLIKFYNFVDSSLYNISLRSGYYRNYSSNNVIDTKSVQLFHSLRKIFFPSEIEQLGQRIDFAHKGLMWYLNEANKGIFLFEGMEIRKGLFKKDSDNLILVDDETVNPNRRKYK